METVLNIYKPPGLTPLETINRFREQNPAYQDLKMSYAGRLDPLAEGVLIVVAGTGIKEREQLMRLDKAYEAEILLGFETDTYDILGMPHPKAEKNLRPTQRRIKEALNALEGEHTMPFPPYSGYKVDGKGLFWWARRGRLDEIEIPEREMNFQRIALQNTTTASGQTLWSEIQKRVKRVTGDFRQNEILAQWEQLLKNDKQQYTLINISVETGSGAYVRSLAHYFGLQLETGAALFALRRTRVGPYTIENSIILD